MTLKWMQDIGAMLEKYSRDVAMILGIPPGFVVSKSTLSTSTSTSQQAENAQTFTQTAQNVCRHLENLLSDVYLVVYGTPGQFELKASPRLNLETVADFKTLVDTGLILPEMAVQIVDSLLTSQNFPASFKHGGVEHARKIQKLLLEPNPGN